MTEDAKTVGVDAPDFSLSALSKKRESLGISLENLSATLKISVERLSALEKGDFDKVGTMSFSRALMMSVCRQYQIDAAPFLKLMPKNTTEEMAVNHGLDVEAKKISGIAFKEGRSSHRGLFKRFWWLIVLVLIIIAVLLLRFPEIKESKSVSTPDITKNREVDGQMQYHTEPLHPTLSLKTTAPVTNHASAPVAITAQAIPHTNLLDTAVSVEAKKIVTASDASTAGAVTADTIPVATAPVYDIKKIVENKSPSTKSSLNNSVNVTQAASDVTVVAKNVLALNATAQVWVSVKSANGSTLFEEIMAAGQSTMIDAPSNAFPLSVVIGDADGITVLVHGKPFYLKPYQNGKVAKFTIAQ